MPLDDEQDERAERARPTIQPTRNAGPFTRARGVASISTTAMIGNGLIATPTRERQRSVRWLRSWRGMRAAAHGWRRLTRAA